MLKRGFTLIELLIVLLVVSLVLIIGLPNMTDWMRNTKVRNTAESIQHGLQLARSEALKRNANVRFTFVTDLTSSCAVAPSLIMNTPAWVVSLDDPSGRCEQDPSEVNGARIIQKWQPGASGNLTWWIWNINFAGTGPYIFNGMGRITPPMPGGLPAQIDVRPLFTVNTLDNLCVDWNDTWGRTRCLRVTVNNGGQVRMCDPKVTDATDPRRCS